ncbi:MAG: DUF5686 family protein [Prevotellaceae bacterium]|nr:DUF5686 family protein [Prevotellaceae bacterium]
MKEVIFYAPLYEHIIDKYQAELYVKGRVNIRKKNQILRFLPNMFHLQKGIREYVMETSSDLHYTAPDIYDQKVKAAVGTSSFFWQLDGRLPEYFHINIYASSLLSNKLLSPLSSNAPHYYRYRLDSISGPSHRRRFHISFHPKSESFQLISGHLVVSDQVWSVRELSFTSRSEILRLRNTIRMGNVGEENEFLPVRYDIDAKFRFLGNVAYTNYVAMLTYQRILQKETGQKAQRRQGSRYDLTESYTLRTDTNAYKRDTTYFNTLRPLPLTSEEKALYRTFYHNDSIWRTRQSKNKSLKFWGQVGDVLINRTTVDVSKMGSVRFSPLINPVLFSYSGSNGFSYRSDFKYNQLFSGDRLLRVVPRIGYNFKRKEFYWSVAGDFYYRPSKRTSVHVEIGNGNRIYSSSILESLKNIPDSLFDFSQIHLDYFRDLYFTARHSWEITNGLSLDVGLSMHKRSAMEPSKLVPILPPDGPGEVIPAGQATRQADPAPITPPQGAPDLNYKLKTTYYSFAPRIRLTWRPGQYYYMDGVRKVNLHARYPGISIDYERGLSGIFKSTGRYERIEVDAQYALALGLLRDLYFRVGAGAFTDQKEVYFVDFTNLRRSNLPVGWNDEIGGVFQLLDGRWYNSSRRYLRAHLVYQTPFLLLQHIKLTRYVLSERIYVNVLAMPHLNPYLEVGYGIGTHLFDFGLFGSFANHKFEEIGCKFTFELFNR